MKLQPRSLQQRTFLYILVPTFVLLVALSIGGFIFLRDILLRQWGVAVVARLQETAHSIDMELSKPKELLLMLQKGQNSEVVGQVVFTYILKKVEELDLVVEVNVIWSEKKDSSEKVSPGGMWQKMEKMERYRLEKYDIGLPRYNTQLNSRTVTLVSEFTGPEGEVFGKVEIVVIFDSLINKLVTAPWWRDYKAYLVDDNGNVLVSTGKERALEDDFPMRAFGTISQLEEDTLDDMKKNPFGVVFGPGVPPEEISGYYHLQEAPWTMVIIAPGHDVLRSIIKFRLHYFVALALTIVLILVFIRRSTDGVTLRIKNISAAAEKLALGEFGPPLQVRGHDEIEELTKNFNMMSRQLHQRLMMKEAIHIAREIQQNLLPNDDFESEGIAVSCKSYYCDETGGDYLDILKFEDNSSKVAVVVGDVVGHGIGAALLMTTIRALLRARIHHPGSPEQVITDVNKLLHHDTARTGNFSTLFYLEIDMSSNVLRWVRAGHDPAIVYTPSTGRFAELKGKGIALGVDAGWSYGENELPISGLEQVVMLTSDGAWEFENENGEIFGRDRLKHALARCCDRPSNEILQGVVDDIVKFRGGAPQDDDITLAIVKLC